MRAAASSAVTTGIRTPDYNTLPFYCRYWYNMASVIEHQKVARRRRRTELKTNRGFTTILKFPASRRERRLFRLRFGEGRRAIRWWSRAGSSRSRSRVVSGFLLFARSRISVLLGHIGRAELLVLDRRDYPLHIAAVVFAVIANTMLLSVSVDRIVLSGAMRSVALPPQRELVTRSLLSPVQSDFTVIGEQAGVDTGRFSQLEVSSYTVRPGDTLGAIALEHDLNLDTLISFNRIDDVRRIQVGAQYQIPDRDGLLYTVRRGEGLSSIAEEHGTTVNAILDANDLRSGTVQEGQVLFVPGARMGNTELRIILGELLAWPTQGVFTSGFGMRPDPFTGRTRFHNGIDLSNRIGTPVRAAASGRVVHVESQIGNYGRFVILRHPDGFQTLYAHLDSFSVRNGQTVSRGQQIGSMGNTGRSTGPHLHFSVIHNGTFVNPMRYLH